MSIETDPRDWRGKGEVRFRLLPSVVDPDAPPDPDVFVLTREPWSWRQVYRRRHWLCGLAEQVGPGQTP